MSLLANGSEDMVRLQRERKKKSPRNPEISWERLKKEKKKRNERRQTNTTDKSDVLKNEQECGTGL